jgi:hypothetical protein
METLADFGVSSYIGIQTFTAGIYKAWLAMDNRLAAAQLATVLLLVVLRMVWLGQSPAPPTSGAGLSRSMSDCIVAVQHEGRRVRAILPPRDRPYPAAGIATAIQPRHDQFAVGRSRRLCDIEADLFSGTEHARPTADQPIGAILLLGHKLNTEL